MSEGNPPAPEALAADVIPLATIPKVPKAQEVEEAPPPAAETRTTDAKFRNQSVASAKSTLSSRRSKEDADGSYSLDPKTKRGTTDKDDKVNGTAKRLMEIVDADEFPSSESEYIQEPEIEEESEVSESVGSYIQQKELEKEPDFFEVLGQIPSVESISLDQSIQAEIMAVVQPIEDPKIDTGRFTDPLTGKVILSDISLESSRSSRARSTHDDDEDEGEEEDEDEAEDVDLLMPIEIEEDKTVQKSDDGLDLWYSIKAPEIKRDTEIDLEEMVRSAHQQAMIRDTHIFLETLIDSIVDKCEYIDPNTILRQNLDKKKLVQELQDRLADLEVEQKARFFLNRKTVEYFRRKKAFRALLEDSPETITQVIEKYKEATTALDQFLGREEETKNSINFRIESLEAEMHRKEEEANDNVVGLEELVRKTMVRDNFEKMKFFVENQLQKMAKLRGEISKTRLVLIQRQHTVATLIEKSNALDNLGEGLHMHDFEHLQTETQALGKKIEERNTDLNKLRTRCNADLHVMAHLKEKQQMMRNTISVQEGALQELIDEKQHCRESLYNLKVERGKIRNEIRDLSFQGGLIDKPALMLDYDDTMERLLKLRAKVEGMRQKHSDLQNRIQELEESCKEEQPEEEHVENANEKKD